MRAGRLSVGAAAVVAVALATRFAHELVGDWIWTIVQITGLLLGALLVLEWSFNRLEARYAVLGGIVFIICLYLTYRSSKGA